MNNINLHKLLSSLATKDMELPLSQNELKDQLIRQYARKQMHEHTSPTAFIKNFKEGYLMKRTFKKRFVSLSPAALIVALAVTSTAGAATYWFTTTVNSFKNGNSVNLTVKDCASLPPSQLKAVGASLTPSLSFNEEYKILNSSYITENEIANAKLAECEQRAVAGIIDRHFPDMQEFSATELKPNSRGLYLPLYETGVVVSVQSNAITVADLDAIKSVPNPTATIQLALDALVLDGDQQIQLTDLRPGDQVYFAYQNKALEGETINKSDVNSLRQLTDVNERSLIRGISKLHVDYHAWYKLIRAINDKAVEAITTDPSHG